MPERKNICITRKAFKAILAHGGTFEGYVQGVGYAYEEVITYESATPDLENVQLSIGNDMYFHPFKIQQLDLSSEAMRKSLKFIFIGSYGYPKEKIPVITNSVEDNKVVEESEISYYENAKKYEGLKYKLGAMNKDSIDCSGLVSLAVSGKYERTWSTSNPKIPGNWTEIKVSASTDVEFIACLKEGDLLVWRGHHAAFYAGGQSLFHACTSRGVTTTDNISYWFKTLKHPAVYRQKKK